MDAFSEVLGGVTLKGALFFSAEFSAPWKFSSPPSQHLAPVLAPGAPHLVIYHFLIEGIGSIRVEDGSKLRLEAGDVVVLPHGDPHSMYSAEGARDMEISPMLRKLQNKDLGAMRAGGGGEVTRFVCGYMACDPLLSRPILTGLPSVFKVNLRTDPSGHWLENSILHLVEEAASGTRGKRSHAGEIVRSAFRRHVTAVYCAVFRSKKLDGLPVREIRSSGRV